MKYADYTATEFLNDEYFQDWVLQPNPENTLFWETWLAQHPHQQAAADKARRALSALVLKPRRLEAAKADRIWDHLQSHVERTQQPRPAPAKRLTGSWYRVAAVFLGLLLAGIGLWKWQLAEEVAAVVVTTGYGETRRVVLPDNSVAILNGNSALEYPGQWSDHALRKVTLRGEAYFEVSHTRNHQKFQVYFSGALKVEVLGTRFLVTSRPRKTRVVLQEGKVRVDLARPGLAPAARTRIVMLPGDLVEEQDQARGLKQYQVPNPESYLAFLQNKLIFRDTPLSEVARVLEDTYGYKITFAEPALATRRFTGSSQPKRIDMLLTAIEKSFNLKIIRKGKNLTIQRR